jgi:hypothetical protein
VRKANTLAPCKGKLIAPWARSSRPGYVNGGNKFDLDTWDTRYFRRLKDFISQASRRGVIVEYVFFSQQYNDGNWRHSPMHPESNINGMPKIPHTAFNTNDNKMLLKYQVELVRKVVRELNGFNNLYYEICNEPWSTRHSGGTIDWHNLLIETIIEEERALPKKHLIATDYDRPDFLARAHPAISVHNTHYAFGSVWVGALCLIESCSHLHGAIGFDETADADHGNTLAGVRTDAWEFIFSGGAVYDHLSWSYTPQDERGGTTAGKLTRRYLTILRDFINRFDFVSMMPDSSLVAGALPGGTTVRALCNRGKEYALYYKTKDGPRADTLSLRIPKGAYRIEWTCPLRGNVLKKETIVHKGGAATIGLPEFDLEAAMGMRRV